MLLCSYLKSFRFYGFITLYWLTAWLVMLGLGFLRTWKIHLCMASKYFTVILNLKNKFSYPHHALKSNVAVERFNPLTATFFNILRSAGENLFYRITYTM